MSITKKDKTKYVVGLATSDIKTDPRDFASNLIIFASVKKLIIFLACFLHFKWFLLGLIFLILMFMLSLKNIISSLACSTKSVTTL